MSIRTGTTMSTETEDTERVMLELKEKERRAAELRAELRESGEALVQFGNVLQRDPELLQLGGGGLRLEEMARIVLAPAPHHLNLERLANLIGELRDVESAAARLRRQIQRLGVKPA